MSIDSAHDFSESDRTLSIRLGLMSELQMQTTFGCEHDVILAVPLGVGKAWIQLRHGILSYGFASPSHRGSYFTAATLKADRVALVEPVAYLKNLVNETFLNMS
jgi:hypothetical protein